MNGPPWVVTKTLLFILGMAAIFAALFTADHAPLASVALAGCATACVTAIAALTVPPGSRH